MFNVLSAWLNIYKVENVFSYCVVDLFKVYFEAACLRSVLFSKLNFTHESILGQECKPSLTDPGWKAWEQHSAERVEHPP